MRQKALVLSFALILTLSVNKLRGADADFIVDSWEGIGENTAVFQLGFIPKSGIVESKEAFLNLWGACKGLAAVPDVDFKENIVYVYTNQNTKQQIAHFLSDEGQFRFVIVTGKVQPQLLGIGFHYQIVVAKRSQVKSFNPEPLTAKLDK